jgi:alpha-D-xyloside xylohydrolase
MSLPLLVRPLSLIVRGSEERPDYDYCDQPRLEAFQIADHSKIETSIPTLSGGVGARCALKREGRRLELSAEGAAKGWSLLLVGVEGARALEGASATADGRGTLIRPAPGASRAVAELP